MRNVIDYDTIASKFELQSRYYIFFDLIPLGKVGLSWAPSNGLNRATIVLQE